MGHPDISILVPKKTFRKDNFLRTLPYFTFGSMDKNAKNGFYT